MKDERNPDGLYVYGVLKTPSEALVPETLGHRSGLTWREFDGMGAVCRRVFIDSFRNDLEKHGQNPDWLQSELLDHNRVVQELMDLGTVLPFRFGTVFAAEDDLNAFFESEGPRLSVKLRTLEGRVECGLKAFCTSDRLIARARESEEVKAERQKLESLPPGRRYFAERRIGTMIDRCTEKILNVVADAIVSQIERSGGIVRLNELIPAYDGLHNVLNADVLLHRGTVFREILDRVVHDQDLELEFRVSGPWPPYSFVEGVNHEQIH